jgi:hypothetical protein
MKNETTMETIAEVSEQLFERGMQLTWDVFDCPWSYLNPMQKFLIKTIVIIEYIEEWVKVRSQKKA